jgi:spore maturation protein CgeB
VRILLVLAPQATGGLVGSTIWIRNLYEPLIDEGHDVVLVDASEGGRARSRRDSRLRTLFSERLWRTFAEEHRRSPFNLVFTYLMDGMVDPSVIDAVGAVGVPTCNFSCNNTHQFDLVRDLSPHYTFSAHSEKDAAAKFRAIGAQPVRFPMAANPKYYRPLGISRVHDVTFVGQRYARRPAYIWHLLEHGVAVDVYGPGWTLRHDALAGEARRFARRTATALAAVTKFGAQQRASTSARLAWLDSAERLRRKYPAVMHGPLDDEQMIAMYSATRISLGFAEVYDRHDPSREVRRHLHLRDFEGPMCGALYLTGDCHELGEFYEPDKEILVYRDEDEMLEKVTYYLSHEHEADTIRQAGLARALRDHTYQRRWATLFNDIGLLRTVA